MVSRYLPLMVWIAVVLFLALIHVGSGADIYVDDDNAGDPKMDGSPGNPYDTIQKALDNASAGDVISIYDGMYNETVIIDVNLTDLTLRGLTGDPGNVVVNAQKKGTVLSVYADGVIIRNVNFTGSKRKGLSSGIYLESVSDVLLQNCIIYRNRYGLYAYNSTNITLRSVTAEDSEMSGIRFDYCTDVAVYGSKSEANRNGIELRSVTGIKVSGSDLQSNDYGIHGSGSSDLEFDHLTAGKSTSVIYLEGCIAVTISDGLFTESSIGLDLVNVQHVNVSRLKLTDLRSTGLSLRGSSDVTFYNTTWAIPNATGIYVPSEATTPNRNVMIENATIRGSPALQIEKSSDFVLINTTISGHVYYLAESGWIVLKNYLWIKVVDTDDNPIQGVDVMIKNNNITRYATAYYGGNRPRTDKNGLIGPILLANTTFTPSGIIRNVTTVSSRYEDWSISDEPIPMNMSRSRQSPEIIIVNHIPELTYWVEPSDPESHEMITFYVNYRDQDAQHPSKKSVFIDGSEHEMSKQSGSPKSGAIYAYSTRLDRGLYRYSFSFSDGIITVSTPEENLTVLNSLPFLWSQSVRPELPRWNFTVLYADWDGDEPSYVMLNISGESYVMEPVNKSHDVRNGRLYFANLSLDNGDYQYYFMAHDGYIMNATSSENYTVSEPRPSLSKGRVSPETGDGYTEFEFRVTYTHPKNRFPVKGPYLYISSAREPKIMQDADDNDYNAIDGKQYIYRMSLPRGNYTFNFTAYDGIFWSSLGNFTVIVNNTPPELDVSVFPKQGTPQDVFRITVTFTDLDDDMPVLHMEVDGKELKGIVQDRPGDIHTSDGKVYLKNGTYSHGNHSLLVTAYDGYVEVQYRGFFLVNIPPSLDLNRTPQYPDTQDVVIFTAIFRDSDNDLPAGDRLLMLLLREEEGLYQEIARFNMTPTNKGDTNTVDGKKYIFQRRFNSSVYVRENGNITRKYLGPGNYKYIVFASDTFVTVHEEGMEFLVTRADMPPTLSSPTISPGTGKSGTRFRCTVVYRDPDGDEPDALVVRVGELEVPMTLTEGENFTAGVKFSGSFVLRDVGSYPVTVIARFDGKEVKSDLGTINVTSRGKNDHVFMDTPTLIMIISLASGVGLGTAGGLSSRRARKKREEEERKRREEAKKKEEERKKKEEVEWFIGEEEEESEIEWE